MYTGIIMLIAGCSARLLSFSWMRSLSGVFEFVNPAVVGRRESFFVIDLDKRFGLAHHLALREQAKRQRVPSLGKGCRIELHGEAGAAGSVQIGV